MGIEPAGRPPRRNRSLSPKALPVDEGPVDLEIEAGCGFTLSVTPRSSRKGDAQRRRRKQRPQTVLASFQQLKQGKAVLSVVTCGELVTGAEKHQ